MTEVPYTLFTGSEPLRAEYDENVCRNPYSLADALKFHEQLEKINQPGRHKKGGKLPPFVGKNRDLAGMGRFSGRSIDKALFVRKAAIDNPKFRQIFEEMLLTENIDNAAKYVEKIQKIDALTEAAKDRKLPANCTLIHGDFRVEAPKLPAEQATVVVVDLPWDDDSVKYYAAAGIFGTIAAIAVGTAALVVSNNPTVGIVTAVPTFIGVTYKTAK